MSEIGRKIAFDKFDDWLNDGEMRDSSLFSLGRAILLSLSFFLFLFCSFSFALSLSQLTFMSGGKFLWLCVRVCVVAFLRNKETKKRNTICHVCHEREDLHPLSYDVIHIFFGSHNGHTESIGVQNIAFLDVFCGLKSIFFRLSINAFPSLSSTLSLSLSLSLLLSHSIV